MKICIYGTGAIGCTVYPATEITEPGVIKHIYGDRFGIGVHFRVDIERRIDDAARVGAHRTSMLQDLEKSRPLEIDALLTSVREIGRFHEC